MFGRHKFVPPEKYGMVEDDVYRFAIPTDLNFPFLDRLGLRAVLVLDSEPIQDSFRFFLEDRGIKLIQTEQDKEDPFKNPWNPIRENVIIDALSALLEKKNYPIAVMCSLGRHRTGTVIGCLRKLQRWNLTSIFEEYRRFAGKPNLLHEQFIELFDTDLVDIPDNGPSWL
uniref:protein-tyrosine-phosphatase n=1 Tax=Palpitomonas bilix TaxID=652834 RepID=A0A7S3G9B1_9EUKA|mmetsp:Transcript_37589/g.97003  ORF Transcript_37589/g.97003 Transcript_37589/m.97003 type:complete len:170 (+) Transcript_37589:162-671(+)